MVSGSTQQRYIKLLNESQGRLLAYLYAHVLNIADTEDLFQQVAIVLWEKFDQFAPGTDFTAWGIRVAELTIKGFLRRKRRNIFLLSDEVMQRIADRQVQVSDEDTSARTAALQLCMKKLPDRQRNLVQRCYAGDTKIREIADDDGRSSASVYTALCRIRQGLLSCIERRIAAEART
jgi:RNA polymerase sigma-70 factor, ECF subfamily